MVDSFLSSAQAHRSDRPQLRNEIAVLKRISKSHRNIVTLHDYFEVLPMSSRHPHAILSCSFTTRPPTISISASIFAPVGSSSTVSAPRVTITKGPHLAPSSASCPTLLPLHHSDAVVLVKTIFGAVAYLHRCDIVHRDLKPENIWFKDSSEEADIMIFNFRHSRIIDSDKTTLLTEISGTSEVRSDLWHPSGSLLTLESILVHGA